MALPRISDPSTLTLGDVLLVERLAREALCGALRRRDQSASYVAAIDRVSQRFAAELAVREIAVDLARPYAAEG